MSRRGWIIVLVSAGVGIAIVIGLVANSQSVAEKQYCNSLADLQGSVATVTSYNPSTSSSDQLQTDIDNVQSDWSAMKSDASQLSNLNQESLDSAWDDFESAVKDLNNGGSVDDVQSAAKSLGSAVKASIDSYDCSDSSSSTS